MRWKEMYVVLAAELLGERRGHDLSADRRGRIEVSLAGLAPRGRDVYQIILVSASSRFQVANPAIFLAKILREKTEG